MTGLATLYNKQGYVLELIKQLSGIFHQAWVSGSKAQ